MGEKARAYEQANEQMKLETVWTMIANISLGNASVLAT